MTLCAAHYRSDIPPERFQEFIDALSVFLEIDLSEHDPGVHAYAHASVAYEPREHFLAAQALLGDGRGRIAVEACYLRPASSSPLAAIGLTGFDAAPALPPELMPFFGRCEPSQRSSTPSFAQLLAAYSASSVTLCAHTEREQHLGSEVEYLRGLLEQQREELKQVRRELHESRMHPSNKDSGNGVEEQPQDDERAPVDFAQLPAWSAGNEQRIVVLPRALNAAKKSAYEDPALAFTALALLAGPYRDMRQGQITREEFERALQGTGLHLSGSTAPSVAGSQGNAYFVSWGGRRRFMDQHLAKGGGRDERFCFRCYFFWDEHSGRAIVGHLPSHLDNSLT